MPLELNGRLPALMPVEIGVKPPSDSTRKPLMPPFPEFKAYRKWESIVSAESSGLTPESVTPVRPFASRRVMLPSNPTRKVERESLGVFDVIANRPLVVTTSQHAAVWLVGTDALTTATPPSGESS